MRPCSYHSYDVDDDGKFPCEFVRDKQGYIYIRKSHMIQLWAGRVGGKSPSSDWSLKCEDMDIEYCEETFLITNSRGQVRDCIYVYLSSALGLVLKGSQKREVILIEPFLECVVDFIGNI